MSDVVTAVAPVENKPSPEVAERVKKALFGPKEDLPVSEEAPASSVPAEEAEAPEGEEGTAQDDAPQAEQDDSPQKAEEPLHTVNVDGKEEAVPLSKLIASYQRSEALGAKERDAAAKIKQASAKEAEVGNLQNTLAQELEAVRAMYQSFVPTPQAMNEALQRGDTATYLKMQQQVNAVSMISQRQQQLVQAQQQAQAQQYEARLVEENAKLVSALPEYAKPEAHEKLKAYLINDGYAPEEVSSISEARLIKTAHKAMLWDELQAKSQATQKKIEAAPKLTKPVARQDAAAVSEERFKQAKTSFLKAGTVKEISPADRRALAKRLGLN